MFVVPSLLKQGIYIEYPPEPSFQLTVRNRNRPRNPPRMLTSLLKLYILTRFEV